MHHSKDLKLQKTESLIANWRRRHRRRDSGLHLGARGGRFRENILVHGPFEWGLEVILHYTDRFS